MTYLPPCPFCGGSVSLVRSSGRFGIAHEPDTCSILPTIWGAPGISEDTISRCWNQRYGVAAMLRVRGEGGLADEMAYLGRFD